MMQSYVEREFIAILNALPWERVKCGVLAECELDRPDEFEWLCVFHLHVTPFIFAIQGGFAVGFYTRDLPHLIERGFQCPGRDEPSLYFQFDTGMKEVHLPLM